MNRAMYINEGRKDNEIIKCVDTSTDENGTVIYQLKSNQGKRINIDEKSLIHYIKSGKLKVDNLIIAANNTLKAVSNKKIEKLEYIEGIIAKHELLGDAVPFEYEIDNEGIVTATKLNKKALLNSALLNSDYTAVIPKYIDRLNPRIFANVHIEKVICKHGLENCDSLFENLNSDKLDLTEFNMTKTKSAKRMFAGCSCKSIIFNKKICNKITKLKEMFIYCTQLESIDLSWLDMKNITDITGMFSDCKKLRYIKLHNFNKDSMIEFEGFLENCKSLISVKNDDTYLMYNNLMALSYLAALNEANNGKNIDKVITLMTEDINKIEHENVGYMVESNIDNVDYIRSKTATLDELINKAKNEEIYISNIVLQNIVSNVTLRDLI